MAEHEPLAPRDLMILAVLAEGRQHGYGIIKAVEERSRGKLLLDPANLYRVLRRIRRDGWIEEVGTGREDEARRRTYGLTSRGRSILKSEVERLDRLLAQVRPALAVESRGGR
ncbi:MAG: PadR family transcriptional regulator [Longimicrobiales bacterium]